MPQVDKRCPGYLAAKLWRETDGQPTMAQIAAACNECGGSGAAIGYKDGQRDERAIIVAEVERLAAAKHPLRSPAPLESLIHWILDRARKADV